MEGDLIYKVDGEEATDVSYTIEETEEGKIPTVTVEAVNTRKLGELKIRKTFNGIPDGSDEITKNLKFRVFGPYGLVGDVTYGEFDKDGTYTFTDLPTGEYVVYELNPYGLSGSWMMLRSSVTSGEATVAAGETANVELNNDYKVPKTSVTIKKTWEDEDNQDGSRPKTLKVTSEEIREALQEPISAIVDAVRIALEKCPPELSADLVDRGMVLAGGGALLYGLDKLISEQTGLPVHLADDPLSAVAEGTGEYLKVFNAVKRASR